MKLEKELVAQLWRISWDDIQMSNMIKVLRSNSRITLSLVTQKKNQTYLFTSLIFVLYLLSDCVCPCLQRGSNYGSLMTAEGNMQIFAKTGYYKVRFYC